MTSVPVDALGNVVATFLNYTGGSPGAQTDVTTYFVFDPFGRLAQRVAAQPAGTPNQFTTYQYGVSPTTGSDITSNEIVWRTLHPDPVTGLSTAAEADTYTVNALGERTSFTDRAGTTHAYSYDVLGRLTSDRVTAFGAGVDTAVQRLDFRYDPSGRIISASSFSAATGGVLLDQVARGYSGFGQLINEWQAHTGGAVNGVTPVVNYVYNNAGGGNYSRRNRINYPSGYTLDYIFVPGTIDAAMVRPSYLSGAKADTGAAVTLEAFKYLGASTVIERARPEINTTLSMVSPTGAAGPVGDKYTGLDRFDRVVLQRWANGPGGNGAIVAQNAYSYDRNGNRLTDSIYGANYTYDNLNQVQSFTRAAWAPGLESQQFAFDALGNWNTLTTDGSAQSRVTNAQNELIDVGGVTLAYTPTGNMIVDNEFRILRYDAWNRLVTVSDEYGTLLARYQYDALNRRITEQVATPTIPDAGDAPIRDLYYSDQWQVLEERVRPSLGVVASTADTRYIWSPVYVDALIARDRNADSNAATGTGGLEERVYALQDANWNTHAIVAASTGQVINRFIYTPFGTHQVLDAGYLAAAPAIPWDRLFQGHEYTDATKLTHMRNRDYSGALGRFVQRDPIGFAAGDNNLYRFVGNGPTVSTDPSGLQSPSRQQLLGGGAPQRSGAGEVAVPEGLRPGDTFYAEIPGFDGPVPIVYRPDLGGSNGYPSAQACGRGPEIGADTRTPYQRYRSDLLMQMRSATWTHERAAAMDEYYLGGPMTTEQAYSESFNVALSMLPVFAVRPGRCGPRRTGHGPFGYPSGKTIPTPSRVLPEPKVLQTGGHTLSKGTIKALGIDRSRAHQALTALKKENGLGAKDHGHRFLDNGDVVDSNTGRVLGNLFDYL